MASALLAGLMLGFAIAASPGPIALLCVQRTLTRGWREGIASGLGVATADACYAGVAAFGLAAVTHQLMTSRVWLALIGGLVLVVIGVRGLLDRSMPMARAAGDTAGLVGAYGSVVGLTLTNPQTVVGFAAAFGGFGSLLGTVPPAGLTAGVLAGSASWWVLLTGVVSLVRRRLSVRAVGLLRMASSGAIVALGLGALAVAALSR